MGCVLQRFVSQQPDRYLRGGSALVPGIPTYRIVRWNTNLQHSPGLELSRGRDLGDESGQTERIGYETVEQHYEPAATVLVRRSD